MIPLGSEYLSTTIVLDTSNEPCDREQKWVEPFRM
jgi:hypothetical protein